MDAKTIKANNRADIYVTGFCLLILAAMPYIIKMQ